MVHGVFKFLFNGARVFGCDARGENIFTMLKNLGRDFGDLLRRFAGAKDHFGKPGAQRAMRIDLRETDVRNGCGLEGLQDFIASHAARAKFFQELSRFGNGHAVTMPQKRDLVTWENRWPIINDV